MNATLHINENFCRLVMCFIHMQRAKIFFPISLIVGRGEIYIPPHLGKGNWAMWTGMLTE